MSVKNHDNNAYTREEFFHYTNILRNATPRIPVCFCIDVSSSMELLTNPENEVVVVGSGHEDGLAVNMVRVKPGVARKTKIDDLRKVLARLIDGLRSHSTLCDASVVSIVTFSRYADTVVNFCEPVSLEGRTIARQVRIGEAETNAATGINMALRKLESMSKTLADAQVESYNPVFILISDGVPTDGGKAGEAVRELRRQSRDNGLTVLPIGIYMNGEGRQWLRSLRDDGQIFTMDSDEDFENVFDMIQELIVCKVPVISADEEIMSGNPYAREAEGSGTAYGQTVSPEELLKFFAFPEGV